MRLFAALVLPEGLTDRLAGLVPEPPDGVRAVPPRRWHLTLAFYGDVDEPGRLCLEQRLERRLAALPAPGPLQIDGGGVFHRSAAYLAVRGRAPSDGTRLADLALACRRAGQACRTPGTVQERRFRPHLTVARARGGGMPDGFAEQLRAARSQPWTCRSVDLVESFLGADPRYVVRRRWTLPQAAADPGPQAPERALP